MAHWCETFLLNGIVQRNPSIKKDWLFLITALHSAPYDVVKTECHERHFWLFVKSHFLGPKFRFDVQGGSRLRPVSGPWAAECGYTLHQDSWGDLTLRVSYLACLVENLGDSEFRLILWFLNEGPDGTESSTPLFLTCPLQLPWSPREITCEENYMEVSVVKQIPSSNQINTEWTASPIESKLSFGEGLREWRVLFRVPELRQQSGWTPLKEETIPVHLVNLLGYHINTTSSRILLRCAYGSRLAYTLQEGEVTVEVVSATILYKHQWTLFRVDTSVACTMNKGRQDGTDVLWVLPWTLPPLVLPPLTQKGMKVGIGGWYLSECDAQRHGYKINDQNGTVEIRIPFGAEGGRLKSHVTEGLYSQSYDVDVHALFEWEDAAWSHTRLRTFRTLSVLNQKHLITITNYTVPSEGEFSVSVGWFPWDVMLANVTLTDKVILWDKAEQDVIRVSQVPFPNGTHSYLLQVPFKHPLISQKYLGKGYRQYSFPVLFSFLMSPNDETFHHSATVETHVQDVVLPKIQGQCTDRGVRILVHYGNMDSEWVVFVGRQRLDWGLVQAGQYILDSNEEYFSMEVPLYAPGMDYETLDLRGLMVSVLVSLVHMEVLEEQTYIQRCVLPVNELLVCLPDTWIVAVVNTDRVFPTVEPSHMTLLDPACGPLETNQSRALFSFPADSCGSVITRKDGHVIYTNEVRFVPQSPAHPRPHHHYSVPLMCMYPESGSHTTAIYQPRSILPPTAPVIPPPHVHPQRSDGKKVLHAGG